MSSSQDNTNGNGNQDDVEDIPMQNITDEEALLACRAYLQRKKKLGWPQNERRKKELASSLALSSTDEGTGYFWEDPTELRYLRTGRPRLFFEDDELDDFDDSDWFDAHSRDSDGDEEDDEVKNALIINEEEEDGLFTGFPSFPPLSFSTKSSNKKDLFQDPEWKTKWYKARWGDHSTKREEMNKKKKIEKYIQQIPSDILQSPELAALSDEDIEGKF